MMRASPQERARSWSRRDPGAARRSMWQSRPSTSSDGATQAQDYLHDQDLQQPCFAACAVNPRELTIEEIPGATAVHHVPIKGELPPGLHPFEGFAVEFTIGSNLYYASASSDPGDIPVAEFEKGALRFHEHAQQHSE